MKYPVLALLVLSFAANAQDMTRDMAEDMVMMTCATAFSILSELQEEEILVQYSLSQAKWFAARVKDREQGKVVEKRLRSLFESGQRTQDDLADTALVCLNTYR